MADLEIDDLVRALELFGARYHAVDVFAEHLSERAGAQLDGGIVELRGNQYRGRAFPAEGVIRFERLEAATAPPGTVAGASMGAAVGAAVTAGRKAESMIGGALVGLLVGGLFGSAVEGAQRPRRVFALQLDPNTREWVAYDGPLLRWMKDRLLVGESPS